MNKQITQLLPDNIHKRIAEYLQPIELKAMIVIYKYTGCKIKKHDYTIPCENCENAYNPSKIYIYSKKKSNPILTNYYINQLKKKIYSNSQLKYPYIGGYLIYFITLVIYLYKVVILQI